MARRVKCRTNMLVRSHGGVRVRARTSSCAHEIALARNLVDLCAYVAHWDVPQLCGENWSVVHAVWETIAVRMRELLPGTFKHLSRSLEAAHIRDRLYCQDAAQLISSDGIVNNVGVSAAYQSPAHRDANDVGWTAALSVKCSDLCNHAGT